MRFRNGGLGYVEEMVFVQAVQKHQTLVLSPALFLEDHQGKCVHRETKAKNSFITG